MTVEIKQLVIRAIAQGPKQEPPTDPHARVKPAGSSPAIEGPQREAIVAECVREVLRTLEQRRSR